MNEPIGQHYLQELEEMALLAYVPQDDPAATRTIVEVASKPKPDDTAVRVKRPESKVVFAASPDELYFLTDEETKQL